MLWAILVVIGLVAIVATALGESRAGFVLFAAVVGLSVMAMQRLEVRRHGRILAAVGLAVLAFGAWRGWQLQGFPHLYAPWLAIGTMLLLGGFSASRRRLQDRGNWALATLGHALAVLGIILTWRAGPDGSVAGIAAWMGAWGILMLQVLSRRWRDRRHAPMRLAEGSFLMFLAGSLMALTAALIWRPAGLPGESLRPAAAVLVGVVFLGLAAFSVPAQLQRGQQIPGSAQEALLNGATFLLLLNVVVVTIVATAGWALVVVFWSMTAWLVAAVTIEYAAWLHGFRIRRPASAEIPAMEVLITGKNEGATLDAAMQENILLPPQLRFVLAMAANSTDDTVAVARRWAAAHPERVRLVMCPGAGKAADLAVAWRTLTSEWVLLLDADETVDAATLALAAAHMTPDVGIIQGRKASHQHDPRGLQRFISVERRFSTRLDHPFWADVCDAGHFAGSGALIRREVPPAVGEWRGDTLTEDIEFSIRFHQHGRWRMVYERAWLVEEGTPRTLASFVRQRARWARGWSEVCHKHLARLLFASPRAGWRTRAGLSWQLIGAVTAPAMAIMPGITIAWLLAGSPGAAPLWALLLAIYILPSRLLTYPTAFFGQRRTQRRARPGEVLAVLLSGYLWVVVGWLIQLHALYQESSGTRRTWQATDKDPITP